MFVAGFVQRISTSITLPTQSAGASFTVKTKKSRLIPSIWPPAEETPPVAVPCQVKVTPESPALREPLGGFVAPFWAKRLDACNAQKSAEQRRESQLNFIHSKSEGLNVDGKDEPSAEECEAPAI